MSFRNGWLTFPSVGGYTTWFDVKVYNIWKATWNKEEATNFPWADQQKRAKGVKKKKLNKLVRFSLCVEWKSFFSCGKGKEKKSRSQLVYFQNMRKDSVLRRRSKRNGKKKIKWIVFFFWRVKKKKKKMERELIFVGRLGCVSYLWWMLSAYSCIEWPIHQTLCPVPSGPVLCHPGWLPTPLRPTRTNAILSNKQR